MNAHGARQKMKQQQQQQPQVQEQLTPPEPVKRQTNAPVISDAADEYDSIERGEPAETISAATPSTAVADADSPEKMFDMYLQAQLMSTSTNMTTLNGQLQKLQQEIVERQNQMNEVKSRMLHTQGSIAMLNTVTAKMREFKLVDDDVQAPALA